MSPVHILNLSEAEREFLKECSVRVCAADTRRTLDVQLRSIVLLDIDKGLTCAEASNKHKVSIGTIHNWIRRYKFYDRESLLTEYRSYDKAVCYKPEFILSAIHKAIKRNGNNRMTLDTLSRFSGLSRSTLTRSRDVWRHLVESPAFLRKPVKKNPDPPPGL